jgi:hypothetical protein
MMNIVELQMKKTRSFKRRIRRGKVIGDYAERVYIEAANVGYKSETRRGRKDPHC